MAALVTVNGCLCFTMFVYVIMLFGTCQGRKMFDLLNIKFC